MHITARHLFYAAMSDEFKILVISISDRFSCANGFQIWNSFAAACIRGVPIGGLADADNTALSAPARVDVFPGKIAAPLVCIVANQIEIEGREFHEAEVHRTA
jgi:hypothetical protein